jgi:hypothetical protein
MLRRRRSKGEKNQYFSVNNWNICSIIIIPSVLYWLQTCYVWWKNTDCECSEYRAVRGVFKLREREREGEREREEKMAH